MNPTVSTLDPKIDQEMEAIKMIDGILQGFSKMEQRRIINYVESLKLSRIIAEGERAKMMRSEIEEKDDE